MKDTSNYKWTEERRQAARERLARNKQAHIAKNGGLDLRRVWDKETGQHYTPGLPQELSRLKGLTAADRKERRRLIKEAKKVATVARHKEHSRMHNRAVRMRKLLNEIEGPILLTREEVERTIQDIDYSARLAVGILLKGGTPIGTIALVSGVKANHIHDFLYHGTWDQPVWKETLPIYLLRGCKIITASMGQHLTAEAAACAVFFFQSLVEQKTKAKKNNWQDAIKHMQYAIEKLREVAIPTMDAMPKPIVAMDMKEIVETPTSEEL